MSTVWSRALLLLAMSCAATAENVSPSPKATPTPAAAATACTEATLAAANTLTASALTSCQQDTDCAEVSSLLGGRCGLFVNREQFSAHFDEWDAQVAACDSSVQVVMGCPSARPVCEQGRCSSTAQVELPELCEENTKVLDTEALAANTCNADADCTRVHAVPTATSFSARGAELLAKLKSTCFSSERLLATRPPPAEPLFCLEHRCSEASTKFTTVVKSASRPKPNVGCLQRTVGDFFVSALKADGVIKPGRLKLIVKLRVDEHGLGNRYDFIQPKPLSEPLKHKLAELLHECTFEPATNRRGIPYAMEYVLNFEFAVRP